MKQYIAKQRGRLHGLQNLGPEYAIGMALFTAGKVAYNKIKSHLTYRVSVQSNQAIYRDLQIWLLDMIPDDKRKSLMVQYEHDPAFAPLSVYYDGNNEQRVVINGQAAVVYVQKAEGSDKDRLQDRLYDEAAGYDRIVFTTYSLAGRKAVEKFLEKVATERRAKDNPPVLQEVAEILDESFELTFLEHDRVQRSGHRDGEAVPAVPLRRHPEQRDFYAKWGMPYHRCYLLHGPPGTGKTSIARAISAHFGLDLYYMPLGDLTKDAKLMSMIARIDKDSVLLLEDVDVFHATRERDDKKGDVSLSGLMNALDGAGTPEGLITFVTTNDISVLDDALIRAGRVDRIEHITKLDDAQFRRMMERFYTWPADLDLPTMADLQASPAEVMEAFKRYPDDPMTMLETIREVAAAQEEVS